MKRLFLFLAGALAGTLGLKAQGQDWAQFQRYEQDNATVRALPEAQRRVVFIGNSITDNWTAHHPDFFRDNGYIGRGISGQTSYQMVLRFRDDVVELHPKAVVINAGINDIAINNHAYVEDRTFHNITLMAEMARAAGIKVILSSVTPCARFPWRKEITDSTDKIKLLNARIRDYARKNKFGYIDYFAAMADADGAMREGLSQEGCHPNAAGYDIMAPLAKAAIDKALK